LKSIEERLHKMKVERIIWMKNWDLRPILKKRQKLYEKYHDFKFNSKAKLDKNKQYERFLIFVTNNIIQSWKRLGLTT
jgi:adenylate kinase family enzyme